MTLYLTELGKSLILQALASPDDASVRFTRVALGNGDASGQGDAATELGNELNSMSITAMSTNGSFVNIAAFLSNTEVPAGYRVTELGVMTENPEDSNEELLFAYAHVSETEAMYLPAAGDYSLETTITLKVYVDDVEDVSAVINESLVYASKAEFEQHTSNTLNPHGVTKAQVGLSEVPNVSTNNQTPTYSVPSSTSNLVSGEKVSTAFGKIAAAVKAVINHIASRANPHNVTYTQAGAAAASHKHSATDITSGVLGVSRGGTGVTTASALAKLIEPNLRYRMFTVPVTLKNGDTTISTASADIYQSGRVRRISATFEVQNVTTTGSLSVHGLENYLGSMPHRGMAFAQQSSGYTLVPYASTGTILYISAGDLVFGSTAQYVFVDVTSIV